MADSIWAELFPEVSEWSRWEASDIDASLKGELAGASESTAVFTWADVIKAEGKCRRKKTI
jgi:hypothetical protein